MPETEGQGSVGEKMAELIPKRHGENILGTLCQREDRDDESQGPDNDPSKAASSNEWHQAALSDFRSSFRKALRVRGEESISWNITDRIHSSARRLLSTETYALSWVRSRLSSLSLVLA